MFPSSLLHSLLLSAAVLVVVVCCWCNCCCHGFTTTPLTIQSSSSTSSSRRLGRRRLYDDGGTGLLLLRRLSSSSLSRSHNNSRSSSSSRRRTSSEEESAAATTTTTTTLHASTTTSTAPATNSRTVDDDDDARQHPLSLSFSDLVCKMDNGLGRANGIWDCYRMGIDPLLYYGYGDFDDDEEDAMFDKSVHENFPSSFTSSSEEDSTTNKSLYFTRDELKSLTVSKHRQNQKLGKNSLRTLRELSKGVSSTSSTRRGSIEGSTTATTTSGGYMEDTIGTISHISIASDSTTKLLVKLHYDNLQVECVIIPWHDTKRSTVCISSQIGCQQGCQFCATGKMGLIRNLTVEEILLQVYLAIKTCRVLNTKYKLSVYPIDGIVFMGMGEPTDNMDNVIQASRILTNQQQFSLSKSKVTVSTVGPTPHVFERLAQAPVTLAWSIHSTKDDIRKLLVPTTKYTMEELATGFVNAIRKHRPITSRKGRTVMFEFVLIDGINDSIDDAHHLMTFVQDMIKDCDDGHLYPLLNLIPYNDISSSTTTTTGSGIGKNALLLFRKPNIEKVLQFRNYITQNSKLKCFVRITRGEEENAACGQLITTSKKKKEKVEGRKHQE